jgi:hypothetical protein
MKIFKSSTTGARTTVPRNYNPLLNHCTTFTLLIFGSALENIDGQKSLGGGPLKISLEMAHKVICPQKKLISCIFKINGTLIVINYCRFNTYFSFDKYFPIHDHLLQFRPQYDIQIITFLKNNFNEEKKN